ncbi:hypothetical protein [Metabacillus arenae]|uniref:Uncharacterized protein n=1 Tax=Metabacillus arenae TaxID=2771434 RepID=A0A926RXG2_9BACI|nr:hypothetical protein [Metabacillus arenae]MBD1380645.1 hypothetical protein [Metabacillus arenae]
MQKQQVWLPLLASAGIGAAAYYSMTRGQGLGKTVQQYVPLIAGMSGQGQQMPQSNQLQDQQMQQNNQVQSQQESQTQAAMNLMK